MIECTLFRPFTSHLLLKVFSAISDELPDHTSSLSMCKNEFYRDSRSTFSFPAFFSAANAQSLVGFHSTCNSCLKSIRELQQNELLLQRAIGKLITRLQYYLPKKGSNLKTSINFGEVLLLNEFSYRA